LSWCPCWSSGWYFSWLGVGKTKRSKLRKTETRKNHLLPQKVTTLVKELANKRIDKRETQIPTNFKENPLTKAVGFLVGAAVG
jgi:hypothetical protein